MKNKIILFKILILFCIFCLGIAGNVFGIGMVTDPIIVDNMLRGGEIVKTVTAFNPTEGEVVYSFKDDGQIAGWVRFFEQDDLDTEITQATIPPKSYYSVIARIKVPENTPNGTYSGSIFVHYDPEKQEEGETVVTVARRVSREVRIEVTDNEVIDIKTTLIPETYDLARGEALKIRVTYDNLGNIVLEPSLQVRIIDVESEKAVFNAIFPYPDEENPVIPGERKEISTIEWHSAGQPDGRYRAEINTLINNEALESNRFNFNIGKAGGSSIGNMILANVSFLGGGNLTAGWFVIGSILLIISSVLALITKKPETLKIFKVGIEKIKSLF